MTESTAVAVAEQRADIEALPLATERRLSALMRQCKTLAKSDLVPKALKDKPENIFALACYGEKFGLDPVHSIQRIYLIQGTFEPKAEVLAGVILRAGHRLRWDHVSDESCTVSIKRLGDDEDWQSTTWTINQARKAGLLDIWVERWAKNSEGKNYKEEVIVGNDEGIFTAEDRAARALGPLPDWAKKKLDAGEVSRKDPWHKFPDDMLAAKALRRGAKRIVPDAVLGLADDEDRINDYLPSKVLATVNPEAPAAVDASPAASTTDPDDEPADGEIVDEAPESVDADTGEIIDAEEVPPPSPADEKRARDKAMRGLMATCGKAFPEDDAPAGQKAHRQRLLRHAAQHAVFKEHRSAKDLTTGELNQVEAWVHANFVSDAAVTKVTYEILDGDIVRFRLGDHHKDFPPAPTDGVDSEAA